MLLSIIDFAEENSSQTSGHFLFRSFDGHGHDDRRGAVGPLDELDPLDLVPPLGNDGQVANLPALEVESKFGSGHVNFANIVREVFAVLERMVFSAAVLVMEADDERHGTLDTPREAPAAYAAQE